MVAISPLGCRRIILKKGKLDWGGFLYTRIWNCWFWNYGHISAQSHSFNFLVGCCLYWLCGIFSLAGNSFCCFNVFNNLCGGYCYLIFVCNYAIEFNRFSPCFSIGWGGRYDKLCSYWITYWNLFFFRSRFKLINNRWLLYPSSFFWG